MDYDENDFQSQNHHLAGEGSNKFPPILRPYALPKFDFDDSLQGHLRFDSLVETEVFLGIENNEDNRWIEEYSRGSCGIEFSKSTTDSCAIPRCHNVWSEATSSESVEMLLKSVGQEEIIARQNITEVSDAFDELGCLTKRMEPNVKPDTIFPKIGDVGDLQSAFSLDGVPENSSSLKDECGEHQSHVQASLQGDQDDPSASNTLINSDLSASRKAELTKSDESLLEGGKCSDVSGRDLSHLVDEPGKKDAVSLEVQLDDVASNTENMVSGDKMKNEENSLPLNEASIANEDDIQKNNDLNKEGCPLKCVDKMNDQNVGEHNQTLDGDNVKHQNLDRDAVESTSSHPLNKPLDSTVECIDEENAGRADVTVLIEPSNIVLKGDSNAKALEGHSEGAYCGTASSASQYEDDVFLKDTQVTDQLKTNVCAGPVMVSEGVKEIDGRAEELGNVTAENFAITEQSIDSFEQRNDVEKTDNLFNNQLASGKLDSSSAAPLHSAEDRDDGDGIRTCASVGLLTETEATDALEVSKVLDAGIRGSSSMQTEPTETQEKNVQGDACNSDAGDVCQGQSTQLLFSGNEEVVPVISNENLATPSSVQLGTAEATVIAFKEVEESVEVALRSTHFDKGDSCEAIPGDLSTSIQCTDTHVEAEKIPVLEPMHAALSGYNEQSSHDTSSQCLPIEGDSDKKTHDETLLAEAHVSSDGTNNMEINIHQSDMTGKDGPVIETVVIAQKNQELTLGENCEREIEVSGDASKNSQSKLTSAPVSEGHSKTDVLKDGSDQADDDQTNCHSITSEGVVISGNGNEKAKSPSKQDIGVSEVRGDSARDSPHVSGPKETNTSRTDKSLTPQVMEASGSGQLKHRVQRGGKRGSPQASEKENMQKSKSTPDRKTRRASGKATGKESARKGNPSKDVPPLRQTELVGKSTNLTISPPGIYQLVQSNEIMQHGQVEGTNTKFAVLTTPTSSLPDLNSAAFPSMVFQQPFTDLQQVQLRAQIFVYGSLISRVVPEELHMISAFGGPDGSRSMWEKAWQACKARARSQTFHPANQEIPSSSRSGDAAADPAVKQSGHQTKVSSSPVIRASTTGTPSSIVNPMIPLSSPLWNIPTPSHDSVQSGMPRGSLMDFQQAFSQMTPHQTPPIISYVGPNHTTWMSQTPFRGPWASPQTPALDTTARFPSLPTEAVQLTPVRESALGLPSGVKHFPLVPPAQSGAHAGNLVVSSASHDLKKVMTSSQTSNDPKVKKRKKVTISDDPARINLPSPLLSEKISTPLAGSTVSSSISASTPVALLSKGTGMELNVVPPPYTLSAPISATTPVALLSKGAGAELNVVPYPLVATGPTKEEGLSKKKPLLLEDAICKVKEARQQAEDAAALAAAAVSHSQEVWDEVYKKQNSGLVSATEAKLASAAAAITAAATVAKAAAAAASVASNAALQAKLMTDEALVIESNPGDVGINSSNSIITAAKEAARRRVEAASAASLRAENLDFVVKAAELAAEAISQAGKVVAMGDPLTLGKLAEAGPEGFWKIDLASSDQAPKMQNGSMGQSKTDNAISDSSISRKNSNGALDSREANVTQQGVVPASHEDSRNSKEEELRLIVGISGSVSPSDTDARGKKFRSTSDPAESTGVFESQMGFGSKDIGVEGDLGKATDAKLQSGIMEGSNIEVFKDKDGYKGAWFSAKVMNLKDGQAYVCYSELSSTEGSGKLKEWIDLKSEEGKAPKIRIAHPMTATLSEGSRKRRRAAVGYLSCSVGDKVDAWIRDSWWEGVVTGKKDETTVAVHIPVLGEASVVRAWHLRPSLVWKNGEWVEWSYAREADLSHHEGDTPREKRAKLGTPAMEAKRKDKGSKNDESVESGKPEESKPLDLSDKEKVFNLGATVDERKPGARRTARPGIRKDGPGVIFGVPKPGKKRKFMEVSKHYVGDQEKKVEMNDSVKLANYLMPRGTGLRGLKASKMYSSEKQSAEVKNKAPKTVKAQGVSSRITSQKNNSRNLVAAPDSSASHSEDESGKNNSQGFGSFSTNKGASEGPLFSSRASSSDSINKDKFAHAPGKLAKIEENKILDVNPVKPTSKAIEPRRSNRQIQPTSRLLEGLQSSLTISKIPSSSHDKTHRSMSRTVAKGKNQG